MPTRTRSNRALSFFQFTREERDQLPLSDKDELKTNQTPSDLSKSENTAPKDCKKSPRFDWQRFVTNQDCEEPNTEEEGIEIGKTFVKQKKWTNIPSTFELKPTEKWWTNWKGKNKFLFDGRLMFGVHFNQLVSTLTLTISTWSVFFIFVVADYSKKWCWPIGIVLLLLSLYSMAKCAMEEPGILPPRPKSSVIDTLPAVVRIKLNYCMTCHVVRPPRAKHCRHCNVCVRRFDHHCPWIGTCVGHRNYRSFILFIFFTAISAMFVSVASTVHSLALLGIIPFGALFVEERSFLASAYVSCFLAVWTAIIAALVGGLMCLHFYMISRGVTTNEFLKGIQSVDTRCWLSKCFITCSESLPESLLPDMSAFPSEEEITRHKELAVISFEELLKEHSAFMDSLY